jgi:hypothetical protein
VSEKGGAIQLPPEGSCSYPMTHSTPPRYVLPWSVSLASAAEPRLQSQAQAQLQSPSQTALPCAALSFAGCRVEGVATGLDTLCGQAYGAQEYQLLGILVQRGMLIR